MWKIKKGTALRWFKVRLILQQWWRATIRKLTQWRILFWRSWKDRPKEIFEKRENLLSDVDIVQFRLKARRGDVLLFGTLREGSAIFITGPITHSSIYLGLGWIIHAVEKGVEITTLHHCMRRYDTCIILRLPRKLKGKFGIINRAIAYAKSQMGTKFEGWLWERPGRWYCSKLVNNSFHKAGFDTGWTDLRKFRRSVRGWMHNFFYIQRWLRPQDMVYGKFRVVLTSHNLVFEKGKLALRVSRPSKIT